MNENYQRIFTEIYKISQQAEPNYSDIYVDLGIDKEEFLKIIEDCNVIFNKIIYDNNDYMVRCFAN